MEIVALVGTALCVIFLLVRVWRIDNRVDILVTMFVALLTVGIAVKMALWVWALIKKLGL